METRGLSTEYGSPIYKGRLGTTDAAIVTSLRRRGAVLLGKTHTTAFAYRTPAPTRNPRNLEHTPGGSSSGSAAAVAAGMVPFALGTQTRGSILRPASFCGVTGFKPSYGLVPIDGVLPYAKSLDTVGFFTHTPADMLALWEAMGHSSGLPAVAPVGAEVGSDAPLSVGVPNPMPEVDAEMATAVQNAIDKLRRAGIRTQSIDIADLLKTLDAATNDIAFYEGARFHEQRWKEHGARLLELADLVEKGLKMPVEQYERALRADQRGTTATGRSVPDNAHHPGACSDGRRSSGSFVHWRPTNQCAVDGAWHTCRLDSDAGHRAAARFAGDRQSRRRRTCVARGRATAPSAVRVSIGASVRVSNDEIFRSPAR